MMSSMILPMVRRASCAVAVVVLAGLLLPRTVHAHEGHEHTVTAPAASDTATVASRLALESPTVELVAVREHDALMIYVDDHASNAPLSGLRLRAVIGSHSLDAAEIAPGTYRIPDDLIDAAVDDTPTAGTHEASVAIRFLFRTGGQDETLEGPLPPGSADADHGSARSDATAPSHWPTALGTAAVLIALWPVARALRRRRVVGTTISRPS